MRAATRVERARAFAAGRTEAELAEEAEGGLYGVLAAELASAPGGFGSVQQPEAVERERLRPLLQDAAR